MWNCHTIKAPVFLCQIADNGIWIATSIPHTTNGPKQHTLPGTAGWLSSPTRSVDPLILNSEVISQGFHNDLFSL